MEQPENVIARKIAARDEIVALLLKRFKSVPMEGVSFKTALEDCWTIAFDSGWLNRDQEKS